MVEKYAELRAKTDEELIVEYDTRASNTSVGTQHFLDELTRRESSRINQSILRLTRWMAIMTGVILVATIFNLVFVLYSIIH